MSANTSLVWRRIDQPGAEYFSLIAFKTGWQLMGTVVVTDEQRPFRIQYTIRCDRAWQTRRVKVDITEGARLHHVDLRVDAEQGWWQAGAELTAFHGYQDIDLGFTPSTNTLPIRRLKLAIGASADVSAVWLQFPSLELRPFAQTYTRLAEDRYRYASEGGYSNELTVDDMGLVRTYPEAWVCEASDKV
ncbi:putative glycolipid-binding domain-containing protein [soil metagenome]